MSARTLPTSRSVFLLLTSARHDKFLKTLAITWKQTEAEYSEKSDGKYAKSDSNVTSFKILRFTNCESQTVAVATGALTCCRSSLSDFSWATIALMQPFMEHSVA